MTTATTKQPYQGFLMAEIAKRAMSADIVSVMADSVVISRRFRDDTEFEAVHIAYDGMVTKGWWNPNRDWDYPTDIREGESGTFTPAE
jgi:hypothetical protein